MPPARGSMLPTGRPAASLALSYSTTKSLVVGKTKPLAATQTWDRPVSAASCPPAGGADAAESGGVPRASISSSCAPRRSEQQHDDCPDRHPPIQAETAGAGRDSEDATTWHDSSAWVPRAPCAPPRSTAAARDPQTPATRTPAAAPPAARRRGSAAARRCAARRRGRWRGARRTARSNLPPPLPPRREGRGVDDRPVRWRQRMMTRREEGGCVGGVTKGGGGAYKHTQHRT